jgi:hypothetical protein
MKTAKISTQILPVILLALTLTSSSFVWLEELFSYEKNIALNEVKQLKTDVEFSGGTINLSTHQEPFAEFKSKYSLADWKAEINWDSLDQHLLIHQPNAKHTEKEDKNKNDWKIKVPRDIETDYNIKIGGGAGNIDLSDSKVRTMEFEAGGGSFHLNLAGSALTNLHAALGGGALEIDLSGKHDRNIKAKIDMGAGGLKLTFPSTSGIRVKTRGMAMIKKGGLKKQDGYYVNDLYGKASNTIDVEINNGVGAIELEVK